jgi:hypothetical protein
LYLLADASLERARSAFSKSIFLRVNVSTVLGPTVDLELGPCKGVVCLANKVIVANLVSPRNRCEHRCGILESFKLGTQLKLRDVHDDIEQRNGGTGIARYLGQNEYRKTLYAMWTNLVRKPHMLGARFFLFGGVIFFELEEKN